MHREDIGTDSVPKSFNVDAPYRWPPAVRPLPHSGEREPLIALNVVAGVQLVHPDRIAGVLVKRRQGLG